jgi:hypothetical protein
LFRWLYFDAEHCIWEGFDHTTVDLGVCGKEMGGERGVKEGNGGVGGGEEWKVRRRMVSVEVEVGNVVSY